MAAGGARALLNEATTRQLGGASVHSSRSQKPAASAARCPSRAQRGCRRAVLVFAEAESGGANPFAKLGRVLQEKARSDFDRVFKGSSKTRERLAVVDELLTYWKLDEAEDLLDELEEALITSDFGPQTSIKVADMLRADVKAGRLRTSDDIRAALKRAVVSLLTPAGKSADLQLPVRPAVVLVVGVNGGGKTTTIGKLAHKFTSAGAKVLLVPADTFRAAAGEQLAVWAQRAGAAFHEVEEGTKPGAVMFSAVDAALRGAAAAEAGAPDIVLGDTSGRLHTNSALMSELAKVKRTVEKRYAGAPHETLLVLDGTTGLNMLNQAREFNAAVGLTGLVVTKLDGSAKGGAVVSVVDQLGLPVKFVGVGEGIEDLQAFDAESFVAALFDKTAVGGGAAA